MNISDLLDPEKMSALDKKVSGSLGFKEKPKSNFRKWENLLKEECPICGFFLDETPKTLKCSRDDFQISKIKAEEIKKDILEKNNHEHI